MACLKTIKAGTAENKGKSAFQFEIHSRGFDFLALNSGIEEFGRKEILSQKQIYRIQLVLEEQNEITVLLDYGFVDYNPLETEDEDLSLLLVRKQVKQQEYHYDGTRAKLALYA